MIVHDDRRVSVPASVFMVKIAASEPLKRVTERMFILSNFTEATKKFTMNYHHSKLFKNFEKHQSTYRGARMAHCPFLVGILYLHRGEG
jgi:hypothetical protein